MRRPTLTGCARGALALALLAAPPWLALRLAAPRAEAELVFVSGPEPETLDPALASGVLELRLLSALYEGLVRLDPETLAPEPAAAESIEVEDGARRFRFALREGLRWSDGAPLGAAAFVESWRRAADPATRSPFRAEAARVAAAARAADGDRAVVIELADPAPEMLALLALPCFYPVPLARVRAHGERWTRPEHAASNGPFRLAEHRPGERLLLARNDRYRSPARLASIEAMTTSGAAVTDQTDFILYETGLADLAFSAPSGAREALGGRPDLRAGPALRTVFLRLNVTRPALASPAARRALGAAIDREALARRVLRGGERPTRGFVPPALAGALGRGPEARDRAGGGPDRDGAGPAPDVDRAARQALDLLDPAARAALTGAPLELAYAASEAQAGHAAEVLQADWKRRLGVEVRLRPMERKAFYQAMRRLDYDVAWSNWVADYPDPTTFLDIFRAQSGNNRTGFADEGYDALLDAAARAPDRAARAARLAEAEARLLEGAPLLPLFHPERAVLVRPWVRGIPTSPLNLVRWEEVEVDAAARAAAGLERGAGRGAR